MTLSMQAAPTRPVLRYHGGKWLLAPWIIDVLPPHRVYVEPFGGAASVLLRKPRSYAEVYNDLDGDVVNLFRVLRDPQTAHDLRERLRLTPWARREFLDSYEPSADPVERARRCVVRSMMAFGTSGSRAGATGFRAKSYRRSSTGCSDWTHYPDALAAITNRLRGVCIEERDALDLIAQQDGPDTLFYVDPPYPHSTRTSLEGRKSPNGKSWRAYHHEMTDDDHRRLAEVLHGVRGMVVLSGYACDLYDLELYPGWRRITRDVLADGGRPRTEVLWLSPNATAVGALPLFAEGAR